MDRPDEERRSGGGGSVASRFEIEEPRNDISPLRFFFLLPLLPLWRCTVRGGLASACCACAYGTRERKGFPVLKLLVACGGGGWWCGVVAASLQKHSRNLELPRLVLQVGVQMSPIGVRTQGTLGEGTLTRDCQVREGRVELDRQRKEWKERKMKRRGLALEEKQGEPVYLETRREWRMRVEKRVKERESGRLGRRRGRERERVGGRYVLFGGEQTAEQGIQYVPWLAFGW
ncbi:hypothetical protein LY78DRAFT_231452 [Colletotrichum sublineola]|nr:hypothetical protein LY78DRAFT_231452 [Colletotrichum sublineola]